MPDFPEQQQEAVQRGAVLLVAALIFTRMTHDTPRVHAENQAKNAFVAARAFVAESILQGHDLASIIKLAEAMA